MKEKIRIGAFISGGGSNLQAIIDACESGGINAKMVFVGADNPRAKGLARAERHSIPRFIVDYGSIIRRYRQDPRDISVPEDFDIGAVRAKQHLFHADVDPARVEGFLRTRAAAEAALLHEMDAYPFDLLVLAGFMRNLTPYFIDRVNTDPEHPRIMNIHPALLPAFPGVDGYGDTYRYGCKIGGGTVHFIDYGEDSGPIIGQRAFPIEEKEGLDAVREKGLKEEWKLYPECIRLFSEGRLKLVRRDFSNQEHSGPGFALRQRVHVQVLN